MEWDPIAEGDIPEVELASICPPLSLITLLVSTMVPVLAIIRCAAKVLSIPSTEPGRVMPG